MLRQETLNKLISPVLELNQALKSAALKSDHAAVAACLAQGADIAYALNGYAEAGNEKSLHRLLAVAKFILCCQFRRHRRGLIEDISNALLSDSFVLPADIDVILKFSGIYYPCDYYRRAAGLLDADEGNDPALNTADILSMIQYVFSSAAGGLLMSQIDTIIHDLFAQRCFENPLLAMRFFSNIDDAELRAELYAAVAAICRQQRQHYFFYRADKGEFLARAAIINSLTRKHQVPYELACIVANEPGLIAWQQGMVRVDSFAHVAPRDIGRIVTDYIAGQSMLSRLDHQLDAYAPASSATASVGMWANHFSSLAGRLFGFYIPPAVADAARPDVGESIRPWGGY